MTQGFREDVGELVFRRAIDRFNGPIFNLLPYEVHVILNVEVFRVRMKLGVMSESQSSLIILVYNGWIGLPVAYLFEQVSVPDC
jgi:hypothetical protein